jgi:hypothetical protein
VSFNNYSLGLSSMFNFAHLTVLEKEKSDDIDNVRAHGITGEGNVDLHSER